MSVTLSRSVGRDGKNLGPDVLKVQALLNLVGATPRLQQDSRCSAQTIGAIEQFQRPLMSDPDGRVDRDGKTLLALNKLTDNGSWPLLYVMRRTFQSSDNWGWFHLMTEQGGWERFAYSYELPWIEDEQGRSKKEKSRIKIGTYKMKVRTDGDKGWRMELLSTGHRTYIQVHRAHKSMYIEGCILPVHFTDFEEAGLQKGDLQIQTKSVELMTKIKQRYDKLKVPGLGNPTLIIAANLPAALPSQPTVTAMA